jgi:hypothetical protein
MTILSRRRVLTGGPLSFGASARSRAGAASPSGPVCRLARCCSAGLKTNARYAVLHGPTSWSRPSTAADVTMKAST